MARKKTRRKKASPYQKAIDIAAYVLCVVFAFTLICNLTIIVKGTLNPETPPKV